MASLYIQKLTARPVLNRVNLLLFIVLICFPANLAAKSQNDNNLQSSESKLESNDEDSSAFTFTGLVETSESFRVLLLPGERVKRISVKIGDRVEKDQVVAELGNDTLSNAKLNLLQNQMQLRKERQQIDVAKLEMKLKQRQLDRLNEEIDNEQKLTSRVEGYISTVSKQLENQKIILSGELEVLQIKLDKMEQGDEQYNILEKIIETQITEIDLRQRRLLLKAPFSSEVVFLAPDSLRTPPGGLVCELWGNSLYKVRGRVMQHQIEHIHIGESVEVSLDFSKNPPAKGTVTMIQQSRMVQDNSGGYPTFDVLINIIDVKQWIKPGMMVSVKKVNNSTSSPTN